jgi:hypothetical protein
MLGMPDTTDAAQTGMVNPLKVVAMVLLITLLSIVLLPFAVVYLVWSIYLRLRFHWIYAREGKFVLFVYSNSPNWKSYIESQVLPPIKDYAIVLNWSERSQWKDWESWPVQAFHHWGGSKEFNPLAVVYCGPTKIRTVRFFQAFRDFKHGDEASLRQAEAQLLELVTARAKTLP